MPNAKNTQTVKELKEKLTKATSIVFADYKGLNANDMNKLRAKVKACDGETTIAKNTLAKIALKEEKLNTKDLELQGQTAMIFGYKDALSPIKALFEFIKEFKLPEVKGGIIDGIFTSGEKIAMLSKLPSREQLLASFVGGLKSPLTGIVNVFRGTQRKFVYTLSAMAEKKAKEVQ